MELEIGDIAPNFRLQNQDGIEVSLKDFSGNVVVLYFYPKDKTPGCTHEACDFRDNMKTLASFGATIIGVSPDSIKSHKSFIERDSLNFTLLSDPNKEVLEAYNAWGLKKLYGKEYYGVLRTTYIIGPSGKVEYIWKNVKVKGHAQEVMDKLKELYNKES